MDGDSEGARFVNVLENLWFPDEGLFATLKPLYDSGSDTSAGASPRSPGSQGGRNSSIIACKQPKLQKSSDRPTKRTRSGFACSFCRARKVRCDAAIYGTPCTNCRRDDHKCLLEPSSQLKSQKIAHRKTSQGYTFIQIAGPQNASDLGALTENILQSNAFQKPDSRMCANLGNNDDTTMNEAANIPDPIITDLDYGDHSSPNSQPPSASSPPRHLTIGVLDEDIIYNIVESQYRIQLLEHFCQSVYWKLPVLSLRNLHDMINRECKGMKPHSLFLFQAIMFAALSEAPITTVHGMGYHSRQDALEALHDRAKTLYKSFHETNPITIIQAVLLLAYGCDADNSLNSKSEKSQGSYWMDAAVSLCHRIKLHKYSALQRLKPFSCSAQRTWRRVWWTCFVHESVLAKREKRPPRFQHGDWDVPMLSVGDFEGDGFLDMAQGGDGEKLAEEFVEIAQMHADQGAWYILDASGLSSDSESPGINIEHEIICQMNGTVGADIKI